MNREHLHLESARGLNGSRDGVWDVVELQIEPDLCAGGQNRAHNFGAFGRVKLEPDFEKGYLAPELLNELERPLLCGDIEGHNDFVSGFCHGRQRLSCRAKSRHLSNSTTSKRFLDFARNDRANCRLCKSSLPRRSIFRSEFSVVAAMASTKSRRSSRRFRFVTSSRSSSAPANRESHFAAMILRCRKAKTILWCVRRTPFSK